MAGFPASLTYKLLTRNHKDYKGKHWARYRALYAGGDQLLENKEVMKDVFPKYSAEEDDTYKERLKRAFYLPYPGGIIDAIVAALTAEPLTIKAEPEPDPFYSEFYADCSKVGGKKQTLAQLLREQVLTALLCKTAWTLVDLPPAPKGPDGQPMEYTNAKAQAEAGALRAYACSVPPECVIDWDEDDTGALNWALVKHTTSQRPSIQEDRDTELETFMYYTRDGWAKYEISHKVGEKIDEGAEVALVDSGSHSFGGVPLIRMSVPEGLHAMGKISCIAVEILNKRSALSWAQYKTLLPVPVAYLSPADPLNPATEDDDRAVAQKHSPGHMRVMAAEDRMEYFSPDAGPFQFAADDLNLLRDEMHRVLHHMALSVDNSGAALQRSADSKAIDAAVTAVVLRALAGYVREHALDIYRTIQIGRKDPEVVWSAVGMEDFDDSTAGALIEQALSLEAVRIPSATFQVAYKFQIAKRLLGNDADEDTLDLIKEELENAISQEDIMSAHEIATGQKPPAENPDEPDEDDGKPAKKN